MLRGQSGQGGFTETMLTELFVEMNYLLPVELQLFIPRKASQALRVQVILEM